MGKIPDNDKGALPLFDYASKFDDFFTYDGFRSYLIHCIQSSGFAMKMIAGWMRLSPTGLSIRMSEAPQENQPHFSDEQIDL